MGCEREREWVGEGEWGVREGGRECGCGRGTVWGVRGLERVGCGKVGFKREWV